MYCNTIQISRSKLSSFDVVKQYHRYNLSLIYLHHSLIPSNIKTCNNPMYFRVYFEHVERVKVRVISHLSIRLPIHYPTGPLQQSESSRRFIGTLNEVPTVRWLSYSLMSGGRVVVSRETACEKSQTNFVRRPIAGRQLITQKL